MRPVKNFCGMWLLIVLCGCHGFVPLSLKGQPDFDVTLLLPPEDVETLQAVGPALVEPLSFWPRPPACDKLDGAFSRSRITDRGVRDQCIIELMTLIDVQYSAYRESLVRVVGTGDLAVDVVTMGLGMAGTLAPAKTTKSILAAISAGLIGAKGYINSDVLYNSTIFVIINQMDADRANERCLILAQMKNATPGTGAPMAISNTVTVETTATIATGANGAPKPSIPVSNTTVKPATPPTYSMFDASSDLIQFYEAGTFSHAMQSLQAKTGSQATSAKIEAKNEKTGNTASNKSSGNKLFSSGLIGNNTTCSAS